MSEMNKPCAVHAPEPFPVAGRLPANEEAVWRNERFQTLECENYRQELNAHHEVRGAAICAHSLYSAVAGVPQCETAELCPVTIYSRPHREARATTVCPIHARPSYPIIESVVKQEPVKFSI
jgi:hypothetical protein